MRRFKVFAPSELLLRLLVRLLPRRGLDSSFGASAPPSPVHAHTVVASFLGIRLHLRLLFPFSLLSLHASPFYMLLLLMIRVASRPVDSLPRTCPSKTRRQRPRRLRLFGALCTLSASSSSCPHLRSSNAHPHHLHLIFPFPIATGTACKSVSSRVSSSSSSSRRARTRSCRGRRARVASTHAPRPARAPSGPRSTLSLPALGVQRLRENGT